MLDMLIKDVLTAIAAFPVLVVQHADNHLGAEASVTFSYNMSTWRVSVQVRPRGRARRYTEIWGSGVCPATAVADLRANMPHWVTVLTS